MPLGGPWEQAAVDEAERLDESKSRKATVTPNSAIGESTASLRSWQRKNGAQRVMPIKQAIPLLRVTDVGRSMEWYHGTLGFVGDPFPVAPPHKFAILRHGRTELMLRHGSPPARQTPRQYDWDVYLRLEKSRIRELFEQFTARGIVTRRLERMFYGLAEFEITDPDGYVICLSQWLADADDLPAPAG